MSESIKNNQPCWITWRILPGLIGMLIGIGLGELIITAIDRRVESLNKIDTRYPYDFVISGEKVGYTYDNGDGEWMIKAQKKANEIKDTVVVMHEGKFIALFNPSKIVP